MMLTSTANEASSAVCPATLSKIALSMQSPILASQEHIDCANTDAILIDPELSMTEGVALSSEPCIYRDDRYTIQTIATRRLALGMASLAKISAAYEDTHMDQVMREVDVEAGRIETDPEDVGDFITSKTRALNALSEDLLRPHYQALARLEASAKETRDVQDWDAECMAVIKLLRTEQRQPIAYPIELFTLRYDTANEMGKNLKGLQKMTAHERFLAYEKHVRESYDSLIKRMKVLEDAYDPDVPQFIVDCHGRYVSLYSIERHLESLGLSMKAINEKIKSLKKLMTEEYMLLFTDQLISRYRRASNGPMPQDETVLQEEAFEHHRELVRYKFLKESQTGMNECINQMASIKAFMASPNKLAILEQLRCSTVQDICDKEYALNAYSSIDEFGELIRPGVHDAIMAEYSHIMATYGSLMKSLEHKAAAIRTEESADIRQDRTAEFKAECDHLIQRMADDRSSLLSADVALQQYAWLDYFATPESRAEWLKRKLIPVTTP